MVAFTPLLAALATASFVAAQEISILFPGGSDKWWIGDSVNTLVWDCNASSQKTFTVQVANPDKGLLTDTLDIIAIQNNFDCSKTIPDTLVNLKAGSGYTIKFANPLNRTQVFGETEPFEIKPRGSAYSTITVTPPVAQATVGATSAGGSAGSSTAGAAASPSPTNAASSTHGSLALAALGAVIGIFIV